MYFGCFLLIMINIYDGVDRGFDVSRRWINKRKHHMTTKDQIMDLTRDHRHRDRVVAAINHQESDRAPLTLGSPSCSLHQIAQKNLMEYLGYSTQEPPLITDNILQIVEPDPRLIHYFDIDLVWILPRESAVRWDEDHTEYEDYFGRKFVAGGGFFNQVAHPIPDVDVEKWKSYQFPQLSQDRFAHLGEQGKRWSELGYGIGIDGPWGMYEISSSLVGVSEYLMMLVLDPGLAGTIAEDVLEQHLIPFYDLLLEDTGDYVDVVGVSDDLGAQNGLLFSPKTYRELFKPLHQRLVDHIRRLTDAKIYMHSDGSIFPLLPDLIEIGVDGLNPVQYTAKDMDLTRLKQEFGKDLGFFGGVVENAALSFQSIDEVRQLVEENVSILKRDGGFIFAPIHNISQEVPPENIIAMYQAGQEFGAS